MRTAFLFSVICFLSFSNLLHAETASPSVLKGKKRSLGSLSFFLDERKPSLPGTSVHLREKDNAYFCLKLNSSDPRFKESLRYLRRVEITLEGGNPPQKLIGKTESWNRLIDPDENGCYVGKIKVPRGIGPGKYKLSELDLWLSSSDSISLREEISQMKPQGIVEVASPQVDAKPPVIERIKNKTDSAKKIRFSNKRARGRIKFELVATDSISGIDPSTLHIFFKMYIDKNLVDILEPTCKTLFPNYSYDCELYFSRAEPHLRTRTVRLVLDSVVVSDRLGNETALTEPAQLKLLTGGDLLQYTFYSSKEERRRWNRPKEELDTYTLQKQMKKMDEKNLKKE